MPITGNVLSLLQTDTGVVLAGTGNNFGYIYRSTDNGLTWAAGVALGDQTTRVNALTKDRNGNIFAAVSGSLNPNFNGIWKGVNHGNLWSKVKSHPLGLGYLDITAIQGFRLVAVGAGVTDTHTMSPIILSSNAGATWVNAPQQHFSHTFNAVSATSDPVLATNYPGDPVGITPAFYGSIHPYTAVGRAGQIGTDGAGNPIAASYNMAVDPMGNEGLDMAAFLIKDASNNYRQRALWAVTALGAPANTEVWSFPATPTGPYKFVKVATLVAERFHVMYVDPVFNWQQIGNLRTIWAGANGKIFVSFNNGLTWALSTDAPINPVYSFVRTTAGVMIAGGASGEIFRFTGTGSTGGGGSGGGGGGGGTLPPTDPPPPVNTPPVAHAKSVSAISGVAKPITLTGSDAENNPLVFTLVTLPTHGAVLSNPPNVTYTSTVGYVGTDSFTYRAWDGKVFGNPATVSITVAAAPIPNTPPVANNQNVNAVQAISKAITLTGFDADGNPLTYTVVSLPSNGSLSGSGASRTYTSGASFSGIDSFTFKVNDGTVDSPTATVTIQVALPIDVTPPTTVFLGRTETTDNAVYVSNKMSFSNVTHVLHYTGSAYENLQFSQNPPYNFLGETLAVGKMAYFGSQVNNNEVPGGTFSSLVFHITRPLQNATLVWEYWNGSAWTALTVYDNSDSFKLEGARSVHWHPPATWGTNAINGITAYWVRVRVSALAASPQAPLQDERFIYTVLLPYVEIGEDAIHGDLPAVSRVQWHNRADNSTSTMAMEADRLVCGLRTLERGRNFQAYLNVSDVHPPFGIAVTAGVASTWSTVKVAPTTRALTVSYSSAPQLNVWNDLATFTLANTVARDYYGSYRVFVRCYKSSGSTNVWQVRTRVTFGSGGSSADSKVVFPSQVADWEVLDLGQLSIPTTQVSQQAGNIGDQLTLSIQGKCSALTSSLTLYDLILIPVDEWAIDARPPKVAVSMLSQVESDNFLDIDSITNPKTILTVLNRNAANQIVGRYQALSNGPAILQAGRQQRLWFFVMATTGSYWYAYPALSGTVMVHRQQRYMGLRGVT